MAREGPEEYAALQPDAQQSAPVCSRAKESAHPASACAARTGANLPPVCPKEAELQWNAASYINRPIPRKNVGQSVTGANLSAAETGAAPGVGSQAQTVGRHPSPADAPTESQTGDQMAKSSPSQPTSVQEPPVGPVEASSKAPRTRKKSVFAFDGFPNIQLLDQQNIKPRPEVNGEDAMHQKAHLGLCSTGAAKDVVRVQRVDSFGSRNQVCKAKRSMRSDALGSTGSSRASSCDEPALATLGAAGPVGASPLRSATFAARKASSSGGPLDPSSSSSSLESVGWSTPELAAGSRTGFNLDSLGSTRPDSKTSDQRYEADKPFESIRTQLSKNSNPDRQIIERHIDNLISRNEAIIDNWNLVGIRSYNSSRDSAAKKPPICYLNSDKPTPVSAARYNKRWSTSVLNSSHLPAVPSESAPVKSSPCDSRNENLRMKYLERKRSYNLKSRSPTQQNPFSLSSPKLGDAQAPIAAPSDHSTRSSTPSSPRAEAQRADAPKPLDSKTEERDKLRHSQDPIQLENAIQNLSLKRKEDELLGWHEQLIFGQSEKLSPAGNGNSAARPLYLDQLNQPAQNLILDRPIVSNLLLDRYRAPVIEHERSLEDQATILRHQQQQAMIGQRMELLRLHQLAASIEQQQQHGHLLAMTVPEPIPSYLASFHWHQQQHQQPRGLEPRDEVGMRKPDRCQARSYSFSQQLSGSYVCPELSSKPALLGEMMLLDHGSELQTQPLDSATPLHRCDTCDISFWTADLLNYHRMTQCAAPKEQPIRPLAFNFNGPNNFNDHNQLSKSVSPPKKQPSPPIADGGSRVTGGVLWAQQLENISILKQQLLTTASVLSSVPHGSLPFKKRKISEPNMRH